MAAVQVYQLKQFFCHICRKKVLIDPNVMTCSNCQGTFIEEIDSFNQDNSLPPSQSTYSSYPSSQSPYYIDNQFQPILRVPDSPPSHQHYRGSHNRQPRVRRSSQRRAALVQRRPSRQVRVQRRTERSRRRQMRHLPLMGNQHPPYPYVQDNSDYSEDSSEELYSDENSSDDYEYQVVHRNDFHYPFFHPPYYDSPFAGLDYDPIFYRSGVAPQLHFVIERLMRLGTPIINERRNRNLIGHALGSFGGGIQFLDSPDNMIHMRMGTIEDVLQLLAGGEEQQRPVAQRDIEMMTRTRVSEEHLKEQENCAVCQEKYTIGEIAMAVRCGHLFHEQCLTPWLRVNNTCPLCRSPVNQ